MSKTFYVLTKSDDLVYLSDRRYMCEHFIKDALNYARLHPLGVSMRGYFRIEDSLPFCYFDARKAWSCRLASDDCF